MNRKGLTYTLLVLVGFGLGVGLVYFLVGHRLEQIEQIERNTTAVHFQNVNGSSAGAGVRGFQPTTTFDHAAQRSIDAVVFISTRMGGEDGAYLNDIFGAPQRSSGSGVIITPDGYIITNNHVIEGAASVVVTLNDMSEYEGEIVATDPNTDLAVLRIRSRDSLPVLRFADSDIVNVGQWVLAVGNPFNLTSTVTAGIVSAKARNIGVLRTQLRTGMGSEYAIESFIQTDAAVNPGNSGGALVNLDGELIGINTAIATENGSYQGYSFAIPSNLAKKIALDLIQYGVVQRGFIGVSIRDIDASIANRRNLRTRKGAYVSDLTNNGAAREAGIEAGDIIFSVNGKTIRNASELQEQIANYRPGDAVTVTLLRNNVESEVRVILRNRQGTTALLPARTDAEAQVSGPPNRATLGVTLRPLDARTRQSLALKGGVVIARIEDGSPMKRVGILEGFIITHLNQQEVLAPEDIQQILQRSSGLVHVQGIKPNGREASYILNLE